MDTDTLGSTAVCIQPTALSVNWLTVHHRQTTKPHILAETAISAALIQDILGGRQFAITIWIK